ncbi:hypothetical protein AMAG_20115 [Allomyces macrogynus ATCC 38327]|uniref:Uncharacterized protein n=1 Tax=Allomyces macrogynus (strain ATCC 38327) TaxID=578462 RepID=A0A0L0T6R4_ALLM3|nr:hypothetical protein AMAG_20115 [Allomyces macrogynus ATCC 38327]|eukprot:KNE70437.1 hypothetical protein AMAG_20115 [Allomyces macrogynus ATCC 38327]
MMSTSVRRAPPAVRSRSTRCTRLGHVVLAVVLALAATAATNHVLARPDPHPGPGPAPNPNPGPGPGPDPLAAPAPRPDPLPLPDPASVFGFLAADDHLAWSGPNPAPLYVPVDDLHRRRQSPSEVLAHLLNDDQDVPAPEPEPSPVVARPRPTGTGVLDEEIPAADDEVVVGHVVDLDDGAASTMLIEAPPGPTPSVPVEEVVFDPITPFDPASVPFSTPTAVLGDPAGPTPFDDPAILPPPYPTNTDDDVPATIVDSDRVCAPGDVLPPARAAPDVLFLTDRDLADIDWTKSTPPSVSLSARAASVLAAVNAHHIPHLLHVYEPVLADLAAFTSPDTAMIPNLCCAWFQTMRDAKLGPHLVQAQKDVYDRLVVWPAMDVASKLGPLANVPLVQAHLVDAARVHGADEMRAMVARVVKGTVGMTREAFVAGMVRERAGVVSEAEDAARVVCFVKWGDAGEWELKGRLTCEVASGEVVEIEKESKETRKKT